MGGKIGSFAPVVAKNSMIPAEIWIGAIIKLLGAAAGAALALVFVPPRTHWGFVRRLLASLIGGFVFAPPMREFAGLQNDWEGTMGGACLAAFASWWAMGAIIRAIRMWKTDRDG